VQNDGEKGTQSIELWDLPVRLVHWSLVGLLPALWWTWRSGQTALHETLGYITLAVLIFRLYWGVAGSMTARFSQFVKGPRQIAAYLRGSSSAHIGHNPLGALSVLLLLGLMIAETGFGLFAEDVDGEESGALARYVSYETADWARNWHAWLFDLILAVVAIHVFAILYYLLVRRDNLVGPIITGRKRFDGDVLAPRMAPAARAVVGVVLSAAIARWISRGFEL
jgi:cytochrome b